MTEEHGKLIEAIARALVEAMNQAPVSDEQWQATYASIADRKTLDSWAQAALTAITEAGYAVVPKDTAEALESAVYVVRNITGVSEWHKLFGRDDPAGFDEDFRCWADHWHETHESVRNIATEQDRAISAAQGDGE